ncbi:MAG: transketolase family protein [Pleomorphochaeta sp.]
MKDFKDYSAMREVVIDTLVDLASDNKDVVMLDADLASAIDSKNFKINFPNRYFNCGIAEANMVGVAAGLSASKLVPFCHTFGCFASRRVYDQMFLSVGYAHQVIHMIGSDPGIEAQANGGTHMPFEDIALMRQIPNINIIEPSDFYSAYSLIKQLYKANKPSYIRVPRKSATLRYDENSTIELGKGIELLNGDDVAIIATGMYMVNQALKATDKLKESGINATVVDLHTIKPLDEELISKVASRCKKIVVCENGRYAGGVGEMISNYIVQTNPVAMSFVNVGEEYGEVGDIDYLSKRFKLTYSTIVDKALALIKSK